MCISFGLPTCAHTIHRYAMKWNVCLHICIHTRPLKAVMRTADTHMCTLIEMHTMVLLFKILCRMHIFLISGIYLSSSHVARCTSVLILIWWDTFMQDSNTSDGESNGASDAAKVPPGPRAQMMAAHMCTHNSLVCHEMESLSTQLYSHTFPQSSHAYYRYTHVHSRRDAYYGTWYNIICRNPFFN